MSQEKKARGVTAQRRSALECLPEVQVLTAAVCMGLWQAGRPDLQNDNLALLLRTLPRRTRTLLQSALEDRGQALRLSKKVAEAAQEGSSSPEWKVLAEQFAMDPDALCELRPPVDAWCLAAMNGSPSSALAQPSDQLAGRSFLARHAFVDAIP